MSVSSVYYESPPMNTTELTTSMTTGWVDASDEAWTYVSADAPTYTFKILGDVTTKYSLGMKVKYDQSGSTNYGIITYSTGFDGTYTNLKLYGGGGDGGTYANNTVYAMTSQPISNMYYSVGSTPFDFPQNPATWTYTITSTIIYSTSSSTFVSLSANLVANCPIGRWNVSTSFLMEQSHASVQDCWADIALSTSTSSVTNPELYASIQGVRLTSFNFRDLVNFSAVINCIAKSAYYTICRTYSGRTAALANTTKTMYINFLCAYL